MTADDPTELLATMRRRVEEASRRLADLTAEVAELRSRDDDLETLVDTLLDLADTVVLVIDDDRRITGLSRAAAARLDGAAVGKPLSSAVSADEFDRLAALLDGDGPPPGAAGDGPVLHRLPHGGAVLVLVDR